MLRSKYKELIGPFIERKSISTDKIFQQELKNAVDWLVALFEQKGFQVETFMDYGNPIVYASYRVDPQLKSTLIYGHYDVQPAPAGDWPELSEEERKGWQTPPFQLTDTGERLVARSIADNKGQVGIHMAAIFDLIESGELGYNVSFLIEGDEETAEGRIDQFLTDQSQRLQQYDFLVISDGLLENNIPTIERSFRGSMSCTVQFTTSEKDLHSGLYGGAVPSASNELASFLGKLQDETGAIAIPGWYEDIQAPTTKETLDDERLNRLLEVTGVQEFIVPKEDVVEAIAFQPSMTITSLQSGYQGIGHQNSIPGAAQAKINFRLAPGQDPQSMMEKFKEFVRANTPSYVDTTIEFSGVMPGVYLAADSDEFQRAEAIMKYVYGKFPIHAFIGASMPISVEVERQLGIPQLLLPLANDDSAIHGANENLTYEALDHGLEFSYQFFKRNNNNP
jgi:acetylornithine deacetylase/succinyl-diaminopimelate desuccinylase-like protein